MSDPSVRGNNMVSGKILSIIFLAAVFMLGLIKIDDPDAWMHLSLGRAIWDNRGLLASEPYVFPSFGKWYGYGSPLFGLVYYTAYRFAGLNGVVLLKALTVLTVFFILLRDSLRPYKNHVVSVAVLLATAFMMRHRFVERPDTFLMVFLSFSIFSINAYMYDEKKYLYALPVVFVLWKYSHPSMLLIAVPFLAFLAGGALQRLATVKGFALDTAPRTKQIITVSIVFLLPACIALLNPSQIAAWLKHQTSIAQIINTGQFIGGAKVVASNWWNQEIMELQPPKWPDVRMPFLMTAVTALSFIANRRRFSFVDLFMVLPFMVLQFTASRFIFLFVMVSGPVLARNLSGLIKDRAWDSPLTGRSVVAALAVVIILLSGLAVTGIGPLSDKSKVFGFGVNMHNGIMTVPEKALVFMDSRRISGRIFNDFSYGGYIIWRNYPAMTVFVDPRGPISGELLEQMVRATSDSAVLDSLDKQFGFDACLLTYPPEQRDVIDANHDIDLALSNPGWALVYWDDFSLLYLKRGGKYKDILEKEEYRFVKPANGTYGLKFRVDDPVFRENAISELNRNLRDTGSARAAIMLGYVYTEARRYREAAESYLEALKLPEGNTVETYGGLAFSYYRLGMTDQSIKCAEKAMALGGSTDILYTLALNYIAGKRYDEARRSLEKAIHLNPNLPYLYAMLIDVYEKSGMPTEAARLKDEYGRMKINLEIQDRFRKALQAQSRKDFESAVKEYKKALEMDPQNAVFHSNLGYVYLDIGLNNLALEQQNKALDIDPNMANAHYGLALIYTRIGRSDLAKSHWQEYLRIEPSGYYSRKAEAALKALEEKTEKQAH